MAGKAPALCASSHSIVWLRALVQRKSDFVRCFLPILFLPLAMQKANPFASVISVLRSVIDHLKNAVSTSDSHVADAVTLQKKLMLEQIAARDRWQKAEKALEIRSGQCKAVSSTCQEHFDQHAKERGLIQEMFKLLRKLATAGKSSGGSGSAAALADVSRASALLDATAFAAVGASSSAHEQLSELLLRVTRLSSMSPQQRRAEATAIWKLLENILQNIQKEEKACQDRVNSCNADLKRLRAAADEYKALWKLSESRYEEQRGKVEEARELDAASKETIKQAVPFLEHLIKVLSGEAKAEDYLSEKEKRLQQENEKLKKENEELRKQNAALKEREAQQKLSTAALQQAQHIESTSHTNQGSAHGHFFEENESNGDVVTFQGSEYADDLEAVSLGESDQLY